MSGQGESYLELRQYLQNSSEEAAADALIPVNLELVKQLWLPNIFIYNLKTFKVAIIGEVTV